MFRTTEKIKIFDSTFYFHSALSVCGSVGVGFGILAKIISCGKVSLCLPAIGGLAFGATLAAVSCIGYHILIRLGHTKAIACAFAVTMAFFCSPIVSLISMRVLYSNPHLVAITLSAFAIQKIFEVIFLAPKIVQISELFD